MKLGWINAISNVEFELPAFVQTKINNLLDEFESKKWLAASTELMQTAIDEHE